MTSGGQARPGAGDPRFFGEPVQRTMAELAALTGAELLAPRRPAGGGASVATPFRGVAPLGDAAPDRVAFLDNRKYAAQLAGTGAGLVVVSRGLADGRPDTSAALVTSEPYLAWARIAASFYPEVAAPGSVHPSAVIEPGASVDASAEVAALAYVGRGASIGPRSRIGVGAVIADGVAIGADCRIGAGVTISHAIVGDRVRLYPGARIGQDGFGFAVGPDGFESVRQLGRVILEDDVEIGANAAVDRGSVLDTVIGAGSRLDNLVMIGHNTRLGRCCVVVSQAGISGSTTLGDFVTVAAQAGLTGHLHIGSKARIGAQAGVMADVEASHDVVGSPAMPVREFFRNVATLRKLSKRG